MRLRQKTNRFHFELLELRRLLSFSIGGDYPAGDSPGAVVAADFNGDGRADLATANFSAGTVTVLLCNANGTFGAPQAFPCGYSTTSVAAGDFNGDGKIDLVTTNGYEWYGTPTVLLGNGDGTFYGGGMVSLAPPPTGEFIIYYYASDVAVADLNADGKPDLLFTGLVLTHDGQGGGQTYNFIAAALGQGNGAFSQSFGQIGSFLGSVVAADLNGDGKVDHITASEVRYGLGNGTFTAPQDIRAVTYGADVTVADFNGDGKPDIATASFSHSLYPSNGGHVLLNNGNGTFQPPRAYVSAPNPTVVASADFNGDGKTDLVTANAGDPSQGIGRSVTVCLGNGNGTFQAPLSFPISGYPLGMTVADFHLDGRVDVAVFISPSTLRVLLNDGNWATRTYIGPAFGGNWSTAANWSPSGVPTASDLVTISGKSVNLAASAIVASLTLTGSASLAVASNGNRVLRASTLFISANSKLDLNDNDLILDYTGPSELAVVQQLINSARNVGAWDGNGITSTAAKNANPTNTTLGAIEASNFKSIHGAAALFNGNAIDSTAVLVKYTYYGDTDFNGVVDFDDYSRTDAGFNQARSGWLNGDFDGNGVVDFDDYSLIDLAFNTQGSALRPSLPLPSGNRSQGR